MAVGSLGVLIISLLVSKFLVAGLVPQGWPMYVYVTIAVVIGYAPSLAWCGFVARRWGDGRFASLGWRFRWSDIGWGSLTWLVAVIVVAAVSALLAFLDIPGSSNLADPSEFADDRAYTLAVVLAAVVAAPVVEELVFRSLVLRGLLSRTGPISAVAAQGVLFGLAHADPAFGAGNIGLVIVLSAVGVTFGVSAYRSNRLGPSVVAHAIFNSVVMIMLLA